MPLKVDPRLNEIPALLQRGGDAARSAARACLDAEADEIVKLARSYAPVLHHDVVGRHGISIKAIQGTGDTSAGPLELSIKKVPGDILARGYTVEVTCGEGLGDYPVMMEEGLAPYGSGAFQLGPLSREKAARGNKVGGKYMERALLDRQDGIPDRVAAAIKEVLK